MRSPWSDATSIDVPRPEYPRPMMARPRWQSLNGSCEYAVRPARGAIEDERPPGEFDGAIVVPFAIETPASGVERALRPDETLFYRRHLDLPGAWAGERVALNFEAVDHEAVVFVDGEPVGRHRGGYLPFTVEVPAGASELVVVVRDPTDKGTQQHGKQALAPGGIWYTATSGIWQDVWAEPLPGNAITRVTTSTWRGLDGIDVLVSCEHACEVTIEVGLPGGGQALVRGVAGEPIGVPIPDARPWSPDDPWLYPLTVTTADDEITAWAAIRTVGLRPIPGAGPLERPAVVLNGRPILLNTPLDQGYWPESGLTAPSDEALVFDLRRMRDLGFNGVRKHVKVESRRFYHHADRLGMLVVQDVVNGGRPRVGTRGSQLAMALNLHVEDRSRRAHKAAGRGSAADREEFAADLVGMIDHLSPHPSVVCWVIFNEAWGQFDTRRLEKLVRRSDPTRLVDAASGWYDQGGGDFRSRHRYVLRLHKPPSHDRRPFLLSEFGGYNLSVPGHTGNEHPAFGYKFFASGKELDEALASLYREQLIPLVEQGLRGCVYTQVSDVEGETNGLLTYDRAVLKPNEELLRQLNRELNEAFARLGAADVSETADSRRSNVRDDKVI
ncbi:glycoside hydrolase family 2 [Brooklawnia cerclae]|uniref:Beta-galactosidase/beta-glucuronidase n=1 Tax=Brooklawnia cerclae TaxID=349934 RepID=A0ABX0SH38_9ACTN|nr:beta-galactosidase/beta-glucuronidase [Brooklawnia cerclae]